MVKEWLKEKENLRKEFQERKCCNCKLLDEIQQLCCKEDKKGLFPEFVGNLANGIKKKMSEAGGLDYSRRSHSFFEEEKGSN